MMGLYIDRWRDTDTHILKGYRFNDDLCQIGYWLNDDIIGFAISLSLLALTQSQSDPF